MPVAHVGSLPFFSNDADRIRFSPVGTSSDADDHLLLGADEAVDVVQPVVLDVQRVAAEAGAVREEHALGAGRRDVDERADHERAVLDVDGLPLGHRRRVREVDVLVARSGELRPRRREDLDRRAVVEREGAVRAGLGEPDVDELPHLVGLLGGEVVELGAVDVGVVELPLVVVEVAPAGDHGWVVTAFQPSCQIEREPSIA